MPYLFCILIRTMVHYDVYICADVAIAPQFTISRCCNPVMSHLYK